MTHGILERTQNVWVGTAFDGIDKVGNFGEKRIVIREDVSFFVVIAGTTGGQFFSLHHHAYRT